MARNNLEERLISFAVVILEIIELLPNTAIGRQMAGQLVRSGTSPALNYGEAQSAESRKDFIHKMGVCLKELRESHICLKIIFKATMIPNNPIVPNSIKESDELIAIFIKSIETARKNMGQESK
jgi:four helix bundle protein